MLDLARRYGVDMPITEQVVAVCHHGRSARDALGFADAARTQERAGLTTLDHYGSDGSTTGVTGGKWRASITALRRGRAVRSGVADVSTGTSRPTIAGIRPQQREQRAPATRRRHGGGGNAECEFPKATPCSASTPSPITAG